MGQYQQWLRYQEIDNSLRKTRQALEEELAQLESQLDTVFFEQQDEDEYPLNGNPIISALFASLESPDAYMPDQPYMENASLTATSWQLTDEPDIELLPEDMNAFLDEQSSTEPRMELPWWLSRITNGTDESGAGSAPERGGNNTNRLVQRWIERWGRQPAPPSEAENDEMDGE